MSDEAAMEAALEQALSGEPVAEKEPDPPADAAPAEEVPAEAAAEEEVEEVSEPELEIEVDGQMEIVRGEDKIREFVQKGVKAGRVFEEVARVRDALTAQAQIQQQQFQFQQAVLGDIAELKAFDQQLEQWSKVDWSAAFDSDPFNAMKLKEQRDTLREMRNNKFQELNQKQQAFLEGNAQATHRARAAEEAALLAKLPEWRNSEKATEEKKSIWTSLNQAGFNDSEIQSVMDHRMLVIARKAMLYDQLQAGKAQGLKQVRTAPPVTKPGAPSADKGKLGFKNFTKEVRKHGQKGNNRAAEELVTAAFNRAFKI